MSSFSGVGMSKQNDSDIASYRRLEAKILAEERERDPNYTNSSCPKCVSRFTNKLRKTKHEDSYLVKNLDTDSLSDASSLSSSRRPSRAERQSYYENDEKQSFSGAFR